MTRASTLAMVLAAGFAITGRAAEPPPTFQDLIGAWRVERLVGSTPISADDAAGKAILGTTITISADLFGSKARPGWCKPRHPTVSEVDTAAKLDEQYGVAPTGLYLSPGTIRPHMPFLDAGCAGALVLDRDRLLWSPGNGYLYTLKRSASG